MKRTVCCLLGIVSIFSYITQAKFVIGCRPCGLFSNFFGVINNLKWCEEKRLTPLVYWGEKSAYYLKEGYNNSYNAWEYYFEPVSGAKYTGSEKIYNRYAAPGNKGKGIPASNKNCKGVLKCRFWGKKIIDKYIRCNKYVAEKIDRFYQKYMAGKKTIGLHLRGTDKSKEIKPIDPSELFAYANSYKDVQYFVATDEHSLLDRARKELHGPVIFYDAHRSDSGAPIHRTMPTKASIGEDVVIEVLLLSYCDLLIHTNSNVSLAALFFSPDMSHILLLPGETIIEGT